MANESLKSFWYYNAQCRPCLLKMRGKKIEFIPTNNPELIVERKPTDPSDIPPSIGNIPAKKLPRPINTQYIKRVFIT
jgi:hypothetical protein